jgi:D-alanine-D-alanine ligase
MRRPDLVVVVSGGLSFERDISLRSGHQVSDALRDAGLEVTEADVDARLLEMLTTLGAGTVVFLAVHGPTGEDGALQDALDASRVPYVGSRGQASRVAYNKPIAKSIAGHHAVATPRYAALTEQTFRDLGAATLLDRFGDYLGYPVVVKPVSGGSAFGLSVAHARGELPQAMVKCFNHGDTALLESYVSGTEVAVGVIDGPDGMIVLPPVEIVPVRGSYDFEARYNLGQTEYFTPARLPPQALDAVCAAAKTMHTALGLRHISRSDFIVDGRGTPQFLEITASPGLTESSVVLLAMREINLSPAQVFSHLATIALNDC